MRGEIEEIPAERLRVLERAAREWGSGSCFRELVENAVAHLGRGGLGEGDGDDLAGLVDFGEQAQKALGEEGGFARAGGRAHEDGAARVERLIALGLIGRRISARRVRHRQPPRRLSPDCGGFS